jgi:hypothetical protein
VDLFINSFKPHATSYKPVRAIQVHRMSNIEL